MSFLSKRAVMNRRGEWRKDFKASSSWLLLCACLVFVMKETQTCKCRSKKINKSGQCESVFLPRKQFEKTFVINFAKMNSSSSFL